jgi:hypothetical protein
MRKETNMDNDSKVLVIGDNGCWAKGPDIKTARRRAHNPDQWNAYELPEASADQIRVSDHGSILYPGDPEKDRPKLLEKGSKRKR